MRRLPPEPERKKKSGICPDIENCVVPVEKEDFEKDCLNDYMNCFLNSSKYPSEWYEEYKKKGKVK